MTPKLYKVAEICELAQLQPYVLKSWEKEFPGIGLQRPDDSGRLYRQADVDQVLRIKQLVFGEGLTLAAARKRLEATGAVEPAVAPVEAAEVMAVLGADAKKRIGYVRDALRSLLQMLDGNSEYQLTPPPAPPVNGGRVALARTRGTASRTKAAARAAT